MSAKLRRMIFGISPEETTFSRRGFRGDDERVRQGLERIGRTFLDGYHAALEENKSESLELRLNAIEVEWRGFAFEGAAMALTLLDFITPRKWNRWRSFLKGPGMAHAYMMHVGAGWALARLPVHPERSLERFDPLLRWLAVDGYGFHEGYFNWRRCVNDQTPPKRLSGYARRVFDQGLGRGLWFVDGADVARIPKTIAAFPPARHADLWAGVGLACAYAGGVDRASIETLRTAAGLYKAHLAQGAAFAAKARQRANNPAAHTEMACKVLCGLSSEAAALITDVALERLPGDGDEPAYEIWRQRIQAQFVMEAVTA